jgi:hypothetical protein
MSEDKKIEIEVPVGYKLVQDGMNIKFVKIDEFLTGWWSKEDTVSGHYVDGVSDICVADSHPRDRSNRNIFAKESQTEGMIAMAMLSQQLADFNGGWEPDWEEREYDKYCIHREFSGGSLAFRVACYWHIYHFLSFRTKEDAEEFLSTNIDEIELAKDFI